MSGTFPLGPSGTPNWVPGYVPPATEWNSWWSNKLDTDDAKLTGAPWLPEAGGVMTGLLTLYGPPLQPLDAATKAYVDQFTPIVGPYLPQSGGTMTGVLTLASDPVGALDAVTKQYADLIAGTANQALTVGGNALARSGGVMSGPLTLAGDPQVPLAAATKQYVDRFLPLAGGTTSGPVNVRSSLEAISLYADSAFYANSFNGWEWSFTVDPATGNKFQTYRAGGWYDFWNATNGTRTWNVPSGAGMQLDGGGHLIVYNGMSLVGTGIIYNNYTGHSFGFGWNGNINCYVDGGYQGDVALTSWVNAVLGGYLPLGGGHITGSFGVDGPVLFGTTLQVYQDVVVNRYMTIGDHGLVGNQGWFYQGTGGQHGFQFWVSGAQVYTRIDNSYDGQITTISDARFKEDIQPTAVDCLDVVRRTPLFQFRMKTIGQDGVLSAAASDAPLVPLGFVAQEQQKVLAASVGGEVSLSINLNVMVAALVGAVQTLAARLDAMIGVAKEA